MMYEKMIRDLRSVAEKESEKFHPTGQIRTDLMARDCADAIERLQAENATLKTKLAAAMVEISHGCETCVYARADGGCKLLPDGDAFSPDYTEGFDRDCCERWQWYRESEGE